MKDAITIRKARPQDAADLAILDDIASHGIARWFWQGAVYQGKTSHAFAWGRLRKLDEGEPYAWVNCDIAEIDTMTAGMICTYRMPNIPEDMKWADPVMKPMFDLMRQCEGEWFVDALATYPEYRNLGVGQKLVEHAIIKAKSAGCNAIGLTVLDTNSDALKLYQNMGFHQADHRTFVPAKDLALTAENHLLFKRSV